MSHYFFPKISENTLHIYKLKVKKFQHASINHKKVIKKKPTGGVNLPPPPPMHNRVKEKDHHSCKYNICIFKIIIHILRNEYDCYLLLVLFHFHSV